MKKYKIGLDFARKLSLNIENLKSIKHGFDQIFPSSFFHSVFNDIKKMGSLSVE